MTERRTRRTLRVFTLSVATLLCAGSAWAQDDPGQLRPVDPPAGDQAPPVRDLGGWLGEEDMQQADPLAPESDVVPPAGPAAESQPAGDQPLSPDEERKRRRQISRNYDRALDTYEDLAKPGRDLGVLERRIGNNERIVDSYSGRMNEAREQRRILQVELYNRMFFLRQQRERGNIDEDTFNRLGREAERNYADRADALKGDLNAYRQEVGTARNRLDALRSERRMLQASRPRRSAPRGKAGAQGAAAAPQPAGVRLLNTLEASLRQLDNFATRHTMRDVDPRTVGASSVGARRSAAATDADEDVDEDEDDDDSWFD